MVSVMNNSRNIDLPVEEEVLSSVVVHDLRGPSINAMAFNKEVIVAAERLNETLENPDRIITPEERKELSEIINVDINPCTEYVHKALLSMESRINKIEFFREDN